jgi:hypothetical protein
LRSREPNPIITRARMIRKRPPLVKKRGCMYRRFIRVMTPAMKNGMPISV